VPVNARDRIGNGPWYNANGALIAMTSPSSTETRSTWPPRQSSGKQASLNEKKGVTNGVGDMPNQHDILTGSQPDGRAYTDAMKSYVQQLHEQRRRQGPVQLGHTDKQAAATAPGTRPTAAAAAAAETCFNRSRGLAVLLRGQLG